MCERVLLHVFFIRPRDFIRILVTELIGLLMLQCREILPADFAQIPRKTIQFNKYVFINSTRGIKYAAKLFCLLCYLCFLFNFALAKK